jgi:hypothetical protein
MICDVENKAWCAEWRPCSLTDAAGNDVPDCVWADTDTGEVVVLVRDATGRVVLTVDDAGGACIKRQWMERPAPLTVTRLGRTTGDAGRGDAAGPLPPEGGSNRCDPAC